MQAQELSRLLKLDELLTTLRHAEGTNDVLKAIAEVEAIINSENDLTLSVYKSGGFSIQGGITIHYPDGNVEYDDFYSATADWDLVWQHVRDNVDPQRLRPNLYHATGEWLAKEFPPEDWELGSLEDESPETA